VLCFPNVPVKDSCFRAYESGELGHQVSQQTRMVKIFKSVEGSRPSMMDVEDERNHVRAAFGLRYRISQPATPAAE
jgi:hypothetical protein